MPGASTADACVRCPTGTRSLAGAGGLDSCAPAGRPPVGDSAANTTRDSQKAFLDGDGGSILIPILLVVFVLLILVFVAINVWYKKRCRALQQQSVDPDSQFLQSDYMNAKAQDEVVRELNAPAIAPEATPGL